jgi:hypothetical protein
LTRAADYRAAAPQGNKVQNIFYPPPNKNDTGLFTAKLVIRRLRVVKKNFAAGALITFPIRLSPEGNFSGG